MPPRLAGSVAVVSAEAGKTSLRDQLVTTRSRRSVLEQAEAARDLATHLLAAPEVRRAASVAAYVGVGREPLTGPLLDRLLAAGKRVIVPVLMPDGDLDWGTYQGPESVVGAPRGLLEPVGPRLGPDAIATPDAVLVPALAVDRAGMRLGRGGGSYDRTLGRVPVGTFVCAVLFDGELLDAVPFDAHDRRVTAVVTPGGGVIRLA